MGRSSKDSVPTYPQPSVGGVAAAGLEPGSGAPSRILLSSCSLGSDADLDFLSACLKRFLKPLLRFGWLGAGAGGSASILTRTIWVIVSNK